ncbi:MAG: hypothetical protein KF795_17905 [Labilithrix sp.]|nr:hypothetical protein [Labilithrix sp.]
MTSARPSPAPVPRRQRLAVRQVSEPVRNDVTIENSVPEEGVEHARAVDVDEGSQTSGHRAPSATDEGRRKAADAEAFGQSFGQGDDVERALAKALSEASAAGRFDVVAQLARELEARRLAREPNVVELPRRGERTGRR